MFYSQDEMAMDKEGRVSARLKGEDFYLRDMTDKLSRGKSSGTISDIIKEALCLWGVMCGYIDASQIPESHYATIKKIIDVYYGMSDVDKETAVMKKLNSMSKDIAVLLGEANMNLYYGLNMAQQPPDKYINIYDSPHPYLKMIEKDVQDELVRRITEKAERESGKYGGE